MKTLYIISKGLNKQSDEEILALEKENRHPRVSMLEEALSADVIDERYLYDKTPAYRRWFYKLIPAGAAQIIEALVLHKKCDVIFTQSERVGLPLAFLMKYLGIKTPHVMIVSRITSMYEKKSRQKMWLLRHSKSALSRILIWSSVQRKIAINQLGVDPQKIKLLKRGTDQRFWHPKPAKTDMICSVGMEMRDYPTLVEALRPLEIPCHIAVGAARGQIFETVKRLYDIEELPENIEVGRKGYEELREMYSRCRFAVVSLLPTDSDNGLTAILEAMAMGKAVICTRVEGQVDVIEEGVTGIFVPQGDPNALRNAIQKLWNDPEWAEEMGIAAREYVEKYHSMEQFVQNISKEVFEVAEIPQKTKTQPIETLEVET
ncbi:MAG: glycosyltransferase family 4 protein [Balneolaceae bacterium]